MTKRRCAFLIVVVGLFTLLFLQTYDVVKLNGVESMLITASVVLLYHLYLYFTPIPPKTRAPVDLAFLARIMELRDGVKRRLGPATDAEAGEGNLDITLVDPGPRRIKTIKHFRQLYDIELATAAAVVDAAPVVIRAGASRTEADYVADYLSQAGAKVDVTEAQR